MTSRKFKFCIPIIALSKDEVISRIKQFDTRYDLFEVWGDYVEDLDEHFVASLISKFGDRLVYVFRRQNLETMKLSLKERLSIASCFSKKESLLDLDISIQKEEIASLHDSAIRTVLSYHNYESTPPAQELRSILDQMKKLGAWICKVSTMCNSPHDALAIMELMADKPVDTRQILLGMGEFGKITRVVGPLWGNEFSFCPPDLESSSAPGQLTRDELEGVLNLIRK